MFSGAKQPSIWIAVFAHFMQRLVRFASKIQNLNPDNGKTEKPRPAYLVLESAVQKLHSAETESSHLGILRQ